MTCEPPRARASPIADGVDLYKHTYFFNARRRINREMNVSNNNAGRARAALSQPPWSACTRPKIAPDWETTGVCVKIGSDGPKERSATRFESSPAAH